MSKQKAYILRGMIALVSSIIVVVLVYVFIQIQIPTKITDSSEEKKLGPTSEEIQEARTFIDNFANSGELPIADVPLSQLQKRLLKESGIDVETFIVTQEVILCLEDKVGKRRLSEIIAGDSVGYREGYTIMECLKR